MSPVNYFDIFKGANGQWYWNLHNGGNHAIIATGGEGFDSRRNAHNSVTQFQGTVEHAFVPDATEQPSMAQDDILEDTDTEDWTMPEDEETDTH